MLPTLKPGTVSVFSYTLCLKPRDWNSESFNRLDILAGILHEFYPRGHFTNRDYHQYWAWINYYNYLDLWDTVPQKLLNLTGGSA